MHAGKGNPRLPQQHPTHLLHTPMPPDKEPSDSRPSVLHRMSGTERQVLDEVARFELAEVIVPELPFGPPAPIARRDMAIKDATEADSQIPSS